MCAHKCVSIYKTYKKLIKIYEDDFVSHYHSKKHNTLEASI
jgi:hypothetical protein